MSNLTPLTATDNPNVDCNNNCNDELETMFVDMVQQVRIDVGQCPDLRPVFRKAYGVVKGSLAEARRQVYRASARSRRAANHIPDHEAKRYPI